jgi:hypothetical protein
VRVAEVTQQAGLLARLDALGHDLKIAGLAHRQQSRAQRAVAPAGGGLLHEALVDLDRADRQ